MDALERCYEMAKEIARTGWANNTNPIFKELNEFAYETGIEVEFDDNWIAVGDEVFYFQD